MRCNTLSSGRREILVVSINVLGMVNKLSFGIELFDIM